VTVSLLLFAFANCRARVLRVFRCFHFYLVILHTTEAHVDCLMPSSVSPLPQNLAHIRRSPRPSDVQILPSDIIIPSTPGLSRGSAVCRLRSRLYTCNDSHPPVTRSTVSRSGQRRSLIDTPLSWVAVGAGIHTPVADGTRLAAGCFGRSPQAHCVPSLVSLPYLVSLISRLICATTTQLTRACSRIRHFASHPVYVAHRRLHGPSRGVVTKGERNEYIDGKNENRKSRRRVIAVRYLYFPPHRAG